jgi:hypothetical protein
MSGASKLKSVNVLVKGHSERQFEHTIVSHLQASPRLRKNLITQIAGMKLRRLRKPTYLDLVICMRRI